MCYCSTELLEKYIRKALVLVMWDYKGIMIMFLFMLQGFILQLLYVLQYLKQIMTGMVKFLAVLRNVALVSRLNFIFNRLKKNVFNELFSHQNARRRQRLVGLASHVFTDPLLA